MTSLMKTCNLILASLFIYSVYMTVANYGYYLGELNQKADYNKLQYQYNELANTNRSLLYDNGKLRETINYDEKRKCK